MRDQIWIDFDVPLLRDAQGNEALTVSVSAAVDYTVHHHDEIEWEVSNTHLVTSTWDSAARKKGPDMLIHKPDPLWFIIRQAIEDTQRCYIQREIEDHVAPFGAMYTPAGLLRRPVGRAA
jgi:hypothetical protein